MQAQYTQYIFLHTGISIENTHLYLIIISVPYTLIREAHTWVNGDVPSLLDQLIARRFEKLTWATYF